MVPIILRVGRLNETCIHGKMKLVLEKTVLYMNEGFARSGSTVVGVVHA